MSDRLEPSSARPAPVRIGAVLPQVELPPDPEAARRFFMHLDSNGYAHALAYDHVLGADTRTRPGWRGAYAATDPFLEVLVAFGWAAAMTTRLELVTGVLILPQRQTALVAKQAATLDHLSGGRVRLGVGIGWNAVEYEALNEEFRTRGRRLEEQVEVLRALWTDPVVDFEGTWHRIDNAGLLPMPVQRPIPVWIGASAEPAIRRAARIADGFFPQGAPGERMGQMLGWLFDELDRAGRDRATFGLDPRINVAKDTPDDWKRQAAFWRDTGVSHLSLVTMGGGYTAIDQHLEALDRGREAIRQEFG
jgi:probable F420-dependent oxidoreductase